MSATSASHPTSQTASLPYLLLLRPPTSHPCCCCFSFIFAATAGDTAFARLLGVARKIPQCVLPLALGLFFNPPLTRGFWLLFPRDRGRGYWHVCPSAVASHQQGLISENSCRHRQYIPRAKMSFFPMTSSMHDVSTRRNLMLQEKSLGGVGKGRSLLAGHPGSIPGKIFRPNEFKYFFSPTLRSPPDDAHWQRGHGT